LPHEESIEANEKQIELPHEEANESGNESGNEQENTVTEILFDKIISIPEVFRIIVDKNIVHLDGFDDTLELIYEMANICNKKYDKLDMRDLLQDFIHDTKRKFTLDLVRNINKYENENFNPNL
jgi:hypothetical protein